MTASDSLADTDGLGKISYQWLSNGAAISGKTRSTYSLTEADVGKIISVSANYTDKLKHLESVTSAGMTVENHNDTPTGNITIGGRAIQGTTLTASNTLADADGLGTMSYQWLRNGEIIGGATQDTYVPTQLDVDKSVSVKVSYTDSKNTAESVTSRTATISNVNDAPTGSVAITGTATQGQVLTATNSLVDIDGLGIVSYQWLSDGRAIRDANQNTYELKATDVGKSISVKATYRDLQNTNESVTSNATNSVGLPENYPPTGNVTISGVAEENQTLTVSNSLADVNGLGVISYQWLNDGAAIKGKNQNTYALTQSDIGKTISVMASYTDGLKKSESMISSAVKIANVNDAPTGLVTISGTTTQGQVLTATNSLADADGLGVVSYSWFSGGNAISGATQSTYTLTSVDVGKAISVKASYIDLQNTAESVTSGTTALVAAPTNYAPTGEVTISGATQKNQTLTVNNTLADVNGMGAINYQWFDNNKPIDGATQPSYSLTANDVGNAISVSASYTDGLGKLESVTSGTTALVTPPTNYPPTGDVTISGTAEQNQTLTVSNSLADANELGAVSYQWFNEGIALSGKTQNSYALTESDVGKNISVTASYTDGLGKLESMTRDSVQIDNVNDEATGSLTITGEAKVGATLSVKNTLVDSDGINDLSFTWLGDGDTLGDGENILLTNDQKDLSISVTANYTDNYGNSEGVSSSETSAVISVNHAPTGKITVKGQTKVGSELSLSNTLKDADGLGDFNYQWLSDGVEIDSATQETYSLTKAEAGKKISVAVSYTDGLDNLESKTSTETAAVKAVAGISGLTKTGDAKNNKLSGLAGDDTLVGGLGADTLTGGKGADIFKFNSVKETGIDVKTRDIITDFKHSEKDKIDLSGIDANAKIAGDQAFKFIGSKNFSKDATAELRFDVTSHILYGSTIANAS